jgi:tight adherence protein B
MARVISIAAAVAAAVSAACALGTARGLRVRRDGRRVWRRIADGLAAGGSIADGSPRSFAAPPVVERWCARSLPGHEPELVWRCWWAAAALVCLGGLIVAGPAAALTGVAMWALASVAALWCWRDRGTRLGDAALVVWMDESSRSVRAGSSLAHAVADGERAVRGTPLQSVASRVAVRARRGELASGLCELTADGDSSESRRLVRRALGVADAAGGPAGRLLDGVAASLRERTAVRQEIHALGTQARASAVVIGVAPVAFFVVTTATDSRVASFVLGTSPGLLCLAAGLLLDLAGAAWMARLVRRVS